MTDEENRASFIGNGLHLAEAFFLESRIADGTNFETFYGEAPRMNPNRSLITGTICGIRVENIEEPLMRELRYLDKLIDELAKGKAMEKILRR